MDRIRVAVTRLTALLVLGTLVPACGGPGGSPSGGGLVAVNAGEPQNLLITTDSDGTDGARILDRLFAGLMSYDADGMPTPEVAESIDTIDNRTYRITLEPGWTFTDGSPVTARSFVDAWNYGALSTNAQALRGFFAPIEGYDALAAAEPTAAAMSGLEIHSDTEFTVRLKAPSIDFIQRLGFTPFYPLPPVAFEDMAAFGAHPIGNGPYVLAAGPGGGPPWRRGVGIDVVPNPDYRGNRIPANRGLRFVFYDDPERAYRDLLADELDVLDTIPTGKLPATFKEDLGDRALAGLVPQNQTLSTPLWLPHFGGEEGRLRRLALSAAIDRDRICELRFASTCSPARDFTAGSMPGFDAELPGSRALEYNPPLARQLWARADAISKWRGGYPIAYNADGGHRNWVAAVAESISDALGLEAQAVAVPTFARLRTEVADRAVDSAFRAGWQADYPSMLAFLEPVFVTGARGNDVGYSNRDFDGALAVAQSAPTLAESYALTNAAQRILLRDMPVIPLWSYLVAGGHSTKVGEVAIGWNGLPDYERITKDQRTA
ncbi:peptide ABC transporter substrate-binding protein [[Mycobacterium] burgundiense]|uniref:ABC transporter substrate-binding protein n=1 Tax=[Mycobacterium] burgundiense TaxID=3064286 RepID=A0ABM9L9K3_9MYCO|nr:ABC transporter substrate-binding protein [Mycolicibacterium sp. MU0053]CAJ1495198.1 ABC transporter substrate-binding protein [Mycolicibacterium sp. MU0053]